MTKIYILTDPRDGEIRYVGKTIETLGRRLGHHAVAAFRGNTYRDRWHAKLLRMGYSPRIELVQEVSDEHWEEAERFWIAHYRSMGCRLTNSALGGGGAFGYRHNDETKAAISAGLTMYYADPVNLAVVTERRQNPAYRTAISSSVREVWQDPSYRTAQQQRFDDPEYRESISSRLKTLWEDPEYRVSQTAAIVATRRDPEFREKQSDGATKSWDNPEHRAKRIAAITASWQPGGAHRVAQERRRAEQAALRSD